jgi:Flp pilus assembly protein TadG
MQTDVSSRTAPAVRGTAARRRATTVGAGPRQRGAASDAGSVSLEMALLYIPLMVLAALVVVMCVRIASAASDVNSAAAAAARQASIARSTSGAVSGGRDGAGATLDARRIPCQPRTVSVDTSAMAPGGSVAVSVSCRVSLSDLSGLGLPGTITLRSTSRQVVDTFRGIQ